MKIERLLKVVFIVLILGFYACQKDSLDRSPEEPSSLDVKIQVLNKSFNLPVGDTKSAYMETSSIVWDSAHMVVSSIKLEAEMKGFSQHDSIEISYKWTGPQLTNLFDTTITFGNFILQPGFYDEIEIVVKGSEYDADAIPIFYLSGVYTKGSATTIPVMVEVYEDVTFKTEKDSVEVTDDNNIDVTSYVQLYLDELMAGINPYDMDNARLTDGVIIISADSNRDIYRTLMRNLVKDRKCEYHYYDKHKKKYKHKNNGTH